MKSLLYIPIITAMLVTGCDKKKQPDPPPVQPSTTGTPQPEHKCGPIPAPPEGHEWVDSTRDATRNVKAFFYNPVNSEEVLVITGGGFLGNSTLLNINLRTGATIHLANLDRYMPSINKSGWILFSDYNNDIFKIKSNGDSLKQLTFTHAAHDPKWDRSGKFFYYFSEAFSSIPAQLIKANAAGALVNSISHDEPYTVPLNKSDKLLVLRRQGETISVIESGMNNANEKLLVTGPYKSQPDQYFFQNLCIDANDENIFWSNDLGIFSFNISSGKTDTLFKSCENTIYNNPMTGNNLNEITFSKHTIKVVSIIHLLHEYQAIEYNVLHNEERVIRLFD